MCTRKWDILGPPEQILHSKADGRHGQLFVRQLVSRVRRTTHPDGLSRQLPSPDITKYAQFHEPLGKYTSGHRGRGGTDWTGSKRRWGGSSQCEGGVRDRRGHGGKEIQGDLDKGRGTGKQKERHRATMTHRAGERNVGAGDKGAGEEGPSWRDGKAGTGTGQRRLGREQRAGVGGAPCVPKGRTGGAERSSVLAKDTEDLR